MKIAKKTSIKDDPSDCGERLILYDSDWANPQKIIKASKYITRTYTHRVPSGFLLTLLRGQGEPGLCDEGRRHVHQLPLPGRELLRQLHLLLGHL